MEPEYRVVACRKYQAEAMMTALGLEGFDMFGTEGVLVADGREPTDHLVYFIRSPYQTTVGRTMWDFIVKHSNKLALVRW